MTTNNNSDYGQENQDRQQRWNGNDDSENTLNQNLNPRETDRTQYSDDAQRNMGSRDNESSGENRDWNSDDLSANDREDDMADDDADYESDLDTDSYDSDSDSQRNSTNRSGTDFTDTDRSGSL